MSILDDLEISPNSLIQDDKDVSALAQSLGTSVDDLKNNFYGQLQTLDPNSKYFDENGGLKQDMKDEAASLFRSHLDSTVREQIEGLRENILQDKGWSNARYFDKYDAYHLSHALTMGRPLEDGKLSRDDLQFMANNMGLKTSEEQIEFIGRYNELTRDIKQSLAEGPQLSEIAQLERYGFATEFGGKALENHYHLDELNFIKDYLAQDQASMMANNNYGVTQAFYAEGMDSKTLFEKMDAIKNPDTKIFDPSQLHAPNLLAKLEQDGLIKYEIENFNGSYNTANLDKLIDHLQSVNVFANREAAMDTFNSTYGSVVDSRHDDLRDDLIKNKLDGLDAGVKDDQELTSMLYQANVNQTLQEHFARDYANGISPSTSKSFHLDNVVSMTSIARDGVAQMVNNDSISLPQAQAKIDAEVTKLQTPEKQGLIEGKAGEIATKLNLPQDRTIIENITSLMNTDLRSEVAKDYFDVKLSDVKNGTNNADNYQIEARQDALMKNLVRDAEKRLDEMVNHIKNHNPAHGDNFAAISEKNLDKLEEMITRGVGTDINSTDPLVELKFDKDTTKDLFAANLDKHLTTEIAKNMDDVRSNPQQIIERAHNNAIAEITEKTDAANELIAENTMLAVHYHRDAINDTMQNMQQMTAFHEQYDPGETLDQALVSQYFERVEALKTDVQEGRLDADKLEQSIKNLNADPAFSIATNSNLGIDSYTVAPEVYLEAKLEEALFNHYTANGTKFDDLNDNRGFNMTETLAGIKEDYLHDLGLIDKNSNAPAIDLQVRMDQHYSDELDALAGELATQINTNDIHNITATDVRDAITGKVDDMISQALSSHTASTTISLDATGSQNYAAMVETVMQDKNDLLGGVSGFDKSDNLSAEDWRYFVEQQVQDKFIN